MVEGDERLCSVDHDQTRVNALGVIANSAQALAARDLVHEEDGVIRVQTGDSEFAAQVIELVRETDEKHRPQLGGVVEPIFAAGDGQRQIPRQGGLAGSPRADYE